MSATLANGLHDDCRLLTPTPAAWVEAAIAQIDDLLIEQAHLEKKAAAAAIRFLFSAPKDAWIQRALSCLAREELIHFERTLRVLEQRKVEYRTLPPSRYPDRLKAAMGSKMPERAMDELLVASLIEARSHERMELLGRSLANRDADASAFYLDLVEAEARHRCVYLDIACSMADEATVRARFARLAAAEAAAISQPDSTLRLHSGHGLHG